MTTSIKCAIAGASFVTALIAVAQIWGPQWAFYLVLIVCGAAAGYVFGLEFGDDKQ